MKHGEVISSNGRWCGNHNKFHGDLFPCKFYPPDLLNKIKKQTESYIKTITSNEWLKKQKARGVPPEVIACIWAFSGISEKTHIFNGEQIVRRKP